MCFLNHFKEIEDPRSHINREYELLDILFLVMTAVASGSEGWSDIEQFGKEKLDWLRKFRPFENGVPVDDTIARIIGRLNPEELTHCFINWVNSLRKVSGKEVVAIDGKTLRRSHQGDKTDALHSITVWLAESGLVFCQKRSEGKKNEIKSAQQLIETLELTNATVTLDAMHTQKNTAKIIRKKQADYVLCVKGNQKNLLEEITDWFDGYGSQLPEEAQFKETVEKSSGRIEVRRYTQLPITEQLPLAQSWPDAKSIVRVERQRTINDNVTQETMYYISSHLPDINFMADTIRSHWQVENKAHWILDVVYKEDQSRIRVGDRPENMAIFRRLCLNLAKQHPKKGSMRGKLKSAGWSDTFREELFFL